MQRRPGRGALRTGGQMERPAGHQPVQADVRRPVQMVHGLPELRPTDHDGVAPEEDLGPAQDDGEERVFGQVVLHREPQEERQVARFRVQGVGRVVQVPHRDLALRNGGGFGRVPAHDAPSGLEQGEGQGEVGGKGHSVGVPQGAARIARKLVDSGRQKPAAGRGVDHRRGSGHRRHSGRLLQTRSGHRGQNGRPE